MLKRVKQITVCAQGYRKILKLKRGCRGLQLQVNIKFVTTVTKRTLFIRTNLLGNTYIAKFIKPWYCMNLIVKTKRNPMQ
jgi:hypothetical protein